MLPDRPRRTPIIGADGKMAPVWVRYFELLDAGMAVTDSFEKESRFLDGANHVDPAVRQTKNRVSITESDLREIKFLGV